MNNNLVSYIHEITSWPPCPQQIIDNGFKYFKLSIKTKQVTVYYVNGYLKLYFNKRVNCPLVKFNSTYSQ